MSFYNKGMDPSRPGMAQRDTFLPATTSTTTIGEKNNNSTCSKGLVPCSVSYLVKSVVSEYLTLGHL